MNTESALIPRLGWLEKIGNVAGLSETAFLWIVWTALLLAGCFLCAGLFCRASAMTGWFLHLCVMKSANYLTYGVDNLTTIGLFYLMISPLPDRLALDAKLWPRQIENASLFGFVRRLIQIHLCLIYFFGGVTKLSGAGWWNGNSLWRALTLPPFNFVNTQSLLQLKVMLPAAGLSICLLELGYSFFIWSGRTRVIWLTLTCLMHLMIGLTMGMYLFSLIMITLNLAGFGPTNFRFVGKSPDAPGRELAAGTS